MSPPSGWQAANQRALMAELAALRERLERREDNTASPPAPTREVAETLARAQRELPAPSALDTLCQAFSLSPFERQVLLLGAGVELDSRFAALCAATQGAPQRVLPTFSLALAVLPDAHWSALAPDAPLRRFHLLELGPGDTLTTRPLRLSERVLHHLTGLSGLDERLLAFVKPLSPSSALTPSQSREATHLVEHWSRSSSAPSRPLLQLCGGDSASRRAIAAAACGTLGLPLHVLRATDIPGAIEDREELCLLWEREAALAPRALLVELEETHSPEAARAASALLDGMKAPVIVSTSQPLRGLQRDGVRVEVRRPDASEQRMLWEAALGPLFGQIKDRLAPLLAQFNLGASSIQAASAEVRARSAQAPSEALEGLLWEACRAQARPQLEGLAHRLEPRSAWRDLSLPAAQLEQLRAIVAHLRQRHRVYGAWGFEQQSARGLGLSVLFSGLSGTGKTLAAEVLASELRLDLYRIDLSQVVDKYIGETEKNLRRLFDAAEEGGAILLFDEADALFGKRSEVKDSHDRHANIEVSYLLQRMEEYRGLAILTTNAKEALDSAFLRRLRFVVDFPFPGPEQRAAIWQRAFPPDTPTEGLNVAALAKLNVAGGNIRTIALNAAFLAAEAGEPVRMAHVLRAARDEYTKLELALGDLEPRP